MSHYSNGYAVAVVVDGNVVDTRQDGVVAVPFGCDYAVRLINRTNKGAVAVISIDGQNVSGGGYIIEKAGRPRSSVDIERPIDKAVTFRFASTESKAAADHGKSGPDVDGSKGLISVEWRPEREILPYGTGYLGATAKPVTDYTPVKRHISSLREAVVGASSLKFCNSHSEQKTSGGIVAPNSLSSGVTVEGQLSNQTFVNVPFDLDYAAHPTILTIKLKGYSPEQGMPYEGTRYCPTCRAKTMKKTDNYCRQCGEKL